MRWKFSIPHAHETAGMATPFPLPEKTLRLPTGMSIRKLGVRMKFFSGMSTSAYLKPAAMSKKPFLFESSGLLGR